MRTQIVIGRVYGKWKVLSVADKRGNEQYYVCNCSCGSAATVRKSVLVAAKSGCMACRPYLASITHGLTHSFEFRVWTAMRKRCLYTKHPHYALYGGRGIYVCAAWDTFEAFYSSMGPSPYGALGSIDRISSEGSYEPANCRWILRSAQSKNRRNVPLVDGKTYPELAVALGIKYSTLTHRIAAGWPKDKWGTPPQERRIRPEPMTTKPRTLFDAQGEKENDHGETA